MTEIELLRAENRGLRMRSEAADIAIGAVTLAAEKSVQVFHGLMLKFEDDPAALEAINGSMRQWSELLDEVISRTKSYSKLLNMDQATRN